MRVVHLSKVTGLAGSEGHLLRLLPGLAQHGLQVNMIVLEDPRYPAASFCRELEARGISVERLPIRGHLDPRLPYLLTRRLAALQPDLVHTHLIHADIYGLPAATRTGVLYAISSRHNDDAFRRNPLIKWINRLAMRHTDRVIAISDWLANFVTSVEGIDHHKIVTVHYGLEAPPRQPGARQQARARLGLPPSVPLVGVFGRLVRQKGVDVLLDAFVDVRRQHSETQLVVVGDGPLRPSLERQAHSLGLGHAVSFTGWLEQARHLMPACDVIAVPSRWEGFGLVTLEAMGCARPVVASRVSALPEIVLDGQTGFLVPPDDPPTLSQAIATLLADPTLADALGQEGLARLLNHFSVEKMVESTLNVYTAVMENNR